MRLERAIAAVWAALFAATIYSAPLRDWAAAALVVLLVADRRRGGEGAIGGFEIAAIAFLAAMLLTALTGGAPQASLLDLRFYPIGALLFVGARRLAVGGGAGVVALAALVLVDLLALDVLAQVATGASLVTGRGTVWGRFTGSFPFPSDVSLLPILLPLAAPILVGGRGIAIGLASLALAGGAVVASGTRAAAAGLGFVVLGSIAVRGRRGWVALGAVALGAALVALVAAGPALRLLGRATGPERRIEQWQAAVRLAAEAPLLGHGPHRFRAVLLERRADPAIARIDLRYAPYPHSVYLETLFGSGLLGLGALLALLAQPFVRRARPGAEGALRAARLSLAVFAGIALFDLSLEKDWVQLALWTPLGVAAGATATPRRETVSASGDASESAAR